jgi:hypothetical protein
LRRDEAAAEQREQQVCGAATELDPEVVLPIQNMAQSRKRRKFPGAFKSVTDRLWSLLLLEPCEKPEQSGQLLVKRFPSCASFSPATS